MRAGVVDEAMAPDREADGDDSLFGQVARAAGGRIRSDARLRRKLPDAGRLHLDRALPFLCVHRRPPQRRDRGTDRLVTALASHLLADGGEDFRPGLEEVVQAVGGAVAETLGEFLLVEVWSGSFEEGAGRSRRAVRVHRDESTPYEVVETLMDALRSLRLCPSNGGNLGVDPELESISVVGREAVAPPGLPPLPEEVLPGMHRIGIEVDPFYRDAVSGAPYPRVLNALRNGLSEVVERAAFTFAEGRTSLDAPHFRALGRTAVGRRARHVDRRLAEVYRTFDTLRQVTPVNTEEAWRSFEASGESRIPRLRYHPLPFDPEHVKRLLFHVPIQGVEDPLLGFLFREKQEELDREITMLRDVDTSRFVHASIQLYGGADAELVELAREVLRRLPMGDEAREYGGDEGEQPGQVGAVEFAHLARNEMDRYRELDPSFDARIEIRNDVTAGLMVIKGVLCISEALSVPRRRVQPLLHHEVGTHVLTWFNGRQQPLRQLASGLAGYDPLQEGIAVLSEHLAGGLSPGRLRVLAGRVLAVDCMLRGATFIDTFRLLTREYHFRPRAAFIITVRVHRGGGLTKDASYLRGLTQLLEYLRSGGSVAPLFVGKLGLSHIDVAQELVLRGVLRTPVLRPRYLDDPEAMARLEACRGMDVPDLVDSVLVEQAT